MVERDHAQDALSLLAKHAVFYQQFSLACIISHCPLCTYLPKSGPVLFYINKMVKTAQTLKNISAYLLNP